MNFNELAIGDVVVLITSLGVICGFFYKVFSLFAKVNSTEKLAKDAHLRIDKIKLRQEEEKNELIMKVEETNIAVNLLCRAVSALINCELNEDDISNIDELKRIKQKLDDKKELV